jgi:hypothetical protein
LRGLVKNYLFVRRGDLSHLTESESVRAAVSVLPVTDKRLGYTAPLTKVGLALTDPQPDAANGAGYYSRAASGHISRLMTHGKSLGLWHGNVKS